MAGGAAAPNRTRDGCRQTEGDFFRLRRSAQSAVVITAAQFWEGRRRELPNTGYLFTLATLAITFVGFTAILVIMLGGSSIALCSTPEGTQVLIRLACPCGAA